MRLFTTGEVLELVGTTPNTFDRWCQEGIIDTIYEIGEGNGKGRHRRFTTMQVVGIAVAAKLRRSLGGCPSSYVKNIVAAFAATNKKTLLEMFTKGETKFSAVIDNRLVLDSPKHVDQIDVEKIYKNTVATH